MNKETIVKFEMKDLEKIISDKIGIDLKIKNFKYSSFGDYDRGNYKEILTDITFTDKE